MSRAEPTGWQQVRDEVRRRIRTREWRPGDVIPGELDLAREFGVARGTVHRALREVAAAGLVERRRRAGTRVAIHPVRQAKFGIPLIRREIEALGAAYTYRLLSRVRRVAPLTVCEPLGVRRSTVMLRVRALHVADERPYVLEDRWVNVQSVPEFEQADLAQVSANEWLLAHVPVSEAELTVAAERCGAADARLLGCRPDDAVLVMSRTTRREDEGVTAVRLVYPPGFAIAMTL
jgi:GntR family histidine utilization transcriptional repressor